MRKKNIIFIIPGKAYAPRSRHALSYINEIKRIASQYITNPSIDPIDLRLEYLFRENRNRLDGDNLLKTFCDALKGVAYVDDGQIHHHEVTLYNMSSSFTIKGVPLTDEVVDCLSQEGFTIVRLRIMKS